MTLADFRTLKCRQPLFFSLIALLILAMGCRVEQESSTDRTSSAPVDTEAGASQEEPSDPSIAGIAVYQQTRRDLAEFDRLHDAVFENGRVPIHYLQWESHPDSLPVILLHGTYNTAHEFIPYAQRLVNEGYRPISVDWYGHGKTPVPPDDLTVSDMADDLGRLLDSLQIEKAVLVGHSRGGMIATEFYRRLPNRTVGLVLIDGGSASTGDYFSGLGKAGLRAWMLDAFDAETGEPLAPAYDSQQALFLNQWEQRGRPSTTADFFEVMSQAQPRDDGKWTQWRQSIARWLGQDNLDNTFQGMWEPEKSPAFIASCTLQQPSSIFRNLDVPVLILDAAGNNPDYRDTSPGDVNAQLKQDHPKWVRHIEYATGHYLHRERPEKFSDDTLAFLKTLPK